MFLIRTNCFRKSQLNFLKNPAQRKTQIIITCYWRWLVSEKIRTEATTTKEKDIKKKTPKEEDEIKRKLHKANKYWNDWKFQIH